MKLNVYFGISIRIILIFSVAMAATYLPEHLREFFGDVKFEPHYISGYNGSQIYIDQNIGSDFDDEWVWGARHYWYFWMMTLLFLLSLVNVIISIVNILKKNYPNEF